MASKAATIRTPRLPKKEMLAWLKNRTSWNHQDWLGLLADLFFSLLELRAEAGRWPGKGAAAPAALEAVPAQEVGMWLLHVAEARDVDAVRPAPV